MPIVALLAGTGDDNFGDEVMLELLIRELHGCRLVTIVHPATELRLARVGLSGRLFSGMILGGGTLINPYFLSRIAPLIDPAIPVWSVGTGVGSAGLRMPEPDLTDTTWIAPLATFRRLTVRGPLSAGWLASAGFDNVEVVGDLALLATPDRPLGAASTRHLLVNLTGNRGEPANEALAVRARNGLALALLELAREGWTFGAVSLHRTDESWLHELGDRVGGWAAPTIRLSSVADAQAALSGASALITVRLHAAVFGWMCGVPTLALGYRRKTLDVASHLGVDDCVLDMSSASEELVRNATLEMARQPRSGSTHESALASRERLRAVLRDVRMALLGISA